MLRKNCSPNSSNMALTSTPVGRRREVWKEGREEKGKRYGRKGERRMRGMGGGREENERYGRRERGE